MSHKQITDWCRKNDIWYLKIDIEIPEVCIEEAQAVYDEGFFVDHRYGDGDGWKSASIHSFVERGGFTQKIQTAMVFLRMMLSGVGQRLLKCVPKLNDG